MSERRHTWPADGCAADQAMRRLSAGVSSGRGGRPGELGGWRWLTTRAGGRRDTVASAPRAQVNQHLAETFGAPNPLAPTFPPRW